jgi:hypothetical protein
MTDFLTAVRIAWGGGRSAIGCDTLGLREWQAERAAVRAFYTREQQRQAIAVAIFFGAAAGAILAWVAAMGFLFGLWMAAR